MDGRATVAEIAAAMEERFGDRADPALGRLTLFLQELHRGAMIQIRSPAPEGPVD